MRSNEFLNLALEYERRQTPSLQGFLAWLREARAEIKRDMEIARDEVRVMTVHGAKGLEAPIVILADTMTPPTGPRPPRLLKLAGGALIWAGRKEDDGATVAAARGTARVEAENEYRRLLYVAMTRAADRLVVCGADGIRARPKGCWYDLVRGALDPHLVEEEDDGEKVLRYRKSASMASAPSAQGATVGAIAENAASRRELPLWLRQPAPAEPPRRAPLSPSSAFDEETSQITPLAASAKDRRKALARGRIVHRLMQSLPDIPTERRKDAAERYVASAAADFTVAERTEIARQVLAILNDERFVEVFAPGSRPEVPIVGQIPRPDGDRERVPGQVDRLIVTEDAVLIADYKTDGIVPSRIEEVPPRYIAQLALYRALLKRLYPEKTVRAALLFTAGPSLVEIPGPAMDAALADILSRSHSAVKVP